MSKSQTASDAAQLEEALGRSIRGSGSDTWLVVRPNLYAVPCAGGYLLYSPLQGLVLLVRGGGIARLLLESDRTIAECLGGCELEGDTELLRRFDEDPVEQPVRFAETGWDFRPTQLMLSLTAACQLACDYCYIRGGDNPRNMPWEVAEAAIRFVAGNAKARGETNIRISFHGQGEPTAAWKLFRDAVMFAEMQASALGLDVSFSVVSNGLLTKEKVAFLRTHQFDVGLSLDGTKDSNDAQRPMRNGGSTYDRVVATMRMLREADMPISIRSTVTARNVDNMVPFVAAMKDDAGCSQVHFEPLCGVGRASHRDAEVQSVLPSFIKNFREAQVEGLRRGVDVTYSTARMDGLRTSFCGAYGPISTFVFRRKAWSHRATKCWRQVTPAPSCLYMVALIARHEISNSTTTACSASLNWM